MSVQSGARLTYGVAGHDATQVIPSPGVVTVTCDCGEWGTTVRRRNSRYAAAEAQNQFRAHANGARPPIHERW